MIKPDVPCKGEVEKRKIAILGGSFNPVTSAHLKIAETVLEKIPGIHQVWLMPAYLHPFEKHRDYSSRRIHMIRLIESEKIRYFGYEIDNRLSGETYYTFTRLLNDPDYKNSYEFYMIVGSDCALEFDWKWKHAKLLSGKIPFIVIPRPGYSLDNYDGFLSGEPHIFLRDTIEVNISATNIREMIRHGKSIAGLVPKRVENFIMSNGLYTASRQQSDETNGVLSETLAKLNLSFPQE